jgi:hypothetical protein
MAEDMMSFYHGDEPGGTPGLLPGPYYCKCFIYMLLVPLLTVANLQGGRVVLLWVP